MQRVLAKAALRIVRLSLARWLLLMLLAGLVSLTQIASVSAADAPPLCRFGIGASQEISGYPVGNLRVGWYADWGATVNPARPGGMTYMPMIRITATGPNAYSATPTGQALRDIAWNNRGATWIVGNEPDRKLFQDGLEPELYARAYHDLYHQIKAADPTARVAAGSIVQPTPLRLEYLDKVLAGYRAQFGQPLPADVWNIHAFILREMSCEYDPNSCWGADVPPGSSAPYGRLYEIDDNDNFEIFKQFILDFRLWMQARGYQNTPLIITEFGILMPPEYGFDAARVSAFMNKTFDYLQTAAGPAGYPQDGNRYVQQFAWYSLDDHMMNGALFDRQSKQPTALGQNYAAYTAKVPSEVNLQLMSARVEVRPGGSDGVRLALTAANTGNVRLLHSFRVRIYDGPPAAGGRPVAPDFEIGNIQGCSLEIRRAISGPLPPGLAGARLWVVLDPDNAVVETNEADNAIEVTETVTIPSRWVWLPFMLLQR